MDEHSYYTYCTWKRPRILFHSVTPADWCNVQPQLVVFFPLGFEQTVEISSTTSLAGFQLESSEEWLTLSLLERVKSPEQPVAIKFTPMRYWVLCFLTSLCLMCCTTLLSTAPDCSPQQASGMRIIKMLLWSSCWVSDQHCYGFEETLEGNEWKLHTKVRDKHYPGQAEQHSSRRSVRRCHSTFLRFTLVIAQCAAYWCY